MAVLWSTCSPLYGHTIVEFTWKLWACILFVRSMHLPLQKSIWNWPQPADWVLVPARRIYVSHTGPRMEARPGGTQNSWWYTVTELAVTAGIHYDNSYIIILYTYNVFNFIFFVQKFDVISEFELNNCRRLQSAFNGRNNPSVGYFNLLN